MKTRNCYVTLGIPRDETEAGIRAAFQDLIRQSKQRLQEITEAFEVLSDTRRRLRHDAELEPAPEPEPVSIFEQPENIRPSYEELFDRYVRNFTRRGVPKSEHVEGLTLEAVISPEEAATGTTLLVGVPVFEIQGRAMVEKRRTITVQTPPFLRAGTILEYPLEQFGIENLYLRVHVLVG